MLFWVRNIRLSEYALAMFGLVAVCAAVCMLFLRSAVKKKEAAAKAATDKMNPGEYTVREKSGKRVLHTFLGILLCVAGIAAGAVSFAFFPEITHILVPGGLVFVLLGTLVIRMARTRIEVKDGSMLAVPMIGMARIGKLSDLKNFSTAKGFFADNILISGKGFGQFNFDSTVPGYDLLKRDLTAAAGGALPEGEASAEAQAQWRGTLRKERAGIAAGIAAGLFLAAGLWLFAAEYNNVHFARIGDEYISVAETTLYGDDIFANGRLVADSSQLAKLTNVTTLWASEEDITDLTGIDALSALSWVELNDNPISDISPLAGLKELHTLKLDGCPVSDISPLYGLDNLYLVGLRDTNVTEEQAAKLRESVPGCNVSI